MAAEPVNEEWPRMQDSSTYLSEHRILDLFDNLTAQLIYHRPEEPKQFLVEVIEKLVKARTTQLDYPCLFDESNIESIFGMLDPTGRGYITLEQYKQALLTLGVDDFDPNPAGGEVNKVMLEVFSKEAKKGLTTASAAHK